MPLPMPVASQRGAMLNLTMWCVVILSTFLQVSHGLSTGIRQPV